VLWNNKSHYVSHQDFPSAPVRVWNEGTPEWDRLCLTSLLREKVDWGRIRDNCVYAETSTERGNKPLQIMWATSQNTTEYCSALKVNCPRYKSDVSPPFLREHSFLSSLPTYLITEGRDPAEVVQVPVETAEIMAPRDALRHYMFNGSTIAGDNCCVGVFEGATLFEGADVNVHLDSHNCPVNALVQVASHTDSSGSRVGAIGYDRKSIADTIGRAIRAQVTARQILAFHEYTMRTNPALLLPDAGHSTVRPYHASLEEERESLQQYYREEFGALGYFAEHLLLSRPSMNKPSTFLAGPAYAVERAHQHLEDGLDIFQYAQLCVSSVWTTCNYKFVEVIECWINDDCFPAYGVNLVESVFVNSHDIHDTRYTHGPCPRQATSFNLPVPQLKVREGVFAIIKLVVLLKENPKDFVCPLVLSHMCSSEEERKEYRQARSWLGSGNDHSVQKAFQFIMGKLTKIHQCPGLGAHHLLWTLVLTRGLDYPILLSYANFCENTASGKKVSMRGVDTGNAGSLNKAPPVARVSGNKLDFTDKDGPSLISSCRAVSELIRKNQAVTEQMNCEGVRTFPAVDIHFPGYPIYFRSWNYKRSQFEMVHYFLRRDCTCRREVVPELHLRPATVVPPYLQEGVGRLSSSDTIKLSYQTREIDGFLSKNGGRGHGIFRKGIKEMHARRHNKSEGAQVKNVCRWKLGKEERISLISRCSADLQAFTRVGKDQRNTESQRPSLVLEKLRLLGRMCAEPQRVCGPIYHDPPPRATDNEPTAADWRQMIRRFKAYSNRSAERMGCTWEGKSFSLCPIPPTNACARVGMQIGDPTTFATANDTTPPRQTGKRVRFSCAANDTIIPKKKRAGRAALAISHDEVLPLSPSTHIEILMPDLFPQPTLRERNFSYTILLDAVRKRKLPRKCCLNLQPPSLVSRLWKSDSTARMGSCFEKRKLVHDLVLVQRERGKPVWKYVCHYETGDGYANIDYCETFQRDVARSYGFPCESSYRGTLACLAQHFGGGLHRRANDDGNAIIAFKKASAAKSYVTMCLILLESSGVSLRKYLSRCLFHQSQEGDRNEHRLRCFSFACQEPMLLVMRQKGGPLVYWSVLSGETSPHLPMLWGTSQPLGPNDSWH